MKSPLLKYLLLILFTSAPFTIIAQEQSVSETEKARAIEFFVEGINDFENQEYESALDKLTAAHLILSDDAGINYALSDVYLAIGDYSNAAYYGQVAAELEPENKWYHLNLADIYRVSGQNELSVESLKTVLEYHPRDVDVLYTLAELYMDFGELEQSNKILDQILEFRGSSFEVHFRKFQNYNALGKDDKALAELENMREISPGNLSTLHTISQYYLELGDLQAAEEVLTEARERNPGDPQTLILLAEIYIYNNEWEQLGEAFLEIVRDPLINPSQKIELVRFVYMQQQDHPGETTLEEQTEKLIRAVGEEEPDYGPAQLIAADLYMQQGEPEKALTKLERATEILPNDAEAWSQRMQVLFTLGRYAEVIELSETANEAAPDNAFIQFFTGTAYMFTDQNELAEEWLEQATMAPSRRNFRSVIYGTLGDVRYDLDNWEDAVQAYEMALSLDSNNHNALNNYAYFLSVREEQLDYALEMSERAVEMQPNNAAYLDTIGWIHFKKGNYEKAREYIQQSVDTGAASAEVFEHLGDVYEALGDMENARKWWEKTLEQDSDRTYLKDRL
ncbi:MAG: tetratricopeptide repeat protein [Balneolaceae bacterium]|nr:tetratricopeptide repeat protein [Balneolaceae bacterium]